MFGLPKNVVQLIWINSRFSAFCGLCCFGCFSTFEGCSTFFQLGVHPSVATIVRIYSLKFHLS